MLHGTINKTTGMYLSVVKAGNWIRQIGKVNVYENKHKHNLIKIRPGYLIKQDISFDVCV